MRASSSSGQKSCCSDDSTLCKLKMRQRRRKTNASSRRAIALPRNLAASCAGFMTARARRYRLPSSVHAKGVGEIQQFDDTAQRERWRNSRRLRENRLNAFYPLIQADQCLINCSHPTPKSQVTLIHTRKGCRYVRVWCVCLANSHALHLLATVFNA